MSAVILRGTKRPLLVALAASEEFWRMVFGLDEETTR